MNYSPDYFMLNYKDSNKIHQLTGIGSHPEMIPATNLEITYTDFRKMQSISESGKNYTVSYGVDEQRRKTVYTNETATVTRYYFGNYEEESDNIGNTRKFHYLSGGAILINNNGVETLYYGYADNQGSLVALTNENGTVVEKYAYDPWGVRRNPDDWLQTDSRTSWLTNRGYTGHEHLDMFGIINMNGRVYDPATAMFFSPDPFVQSPGNWLNYNRYAYVMHNPLKFTDPSGYYPKEMGDHPTPAFSGYNLDQLILSEGGFGGGGSGSYYYTKMFGRGDITYNWYSGNYQYDNGEIATYDQAMNQLYSNTRSNDISTISGSSLFGYDHLYSLSINGQLRLAGSIGGEITGLVGGHFVVTNNAFSAVLAANGEVTAWGKNSAGEVSNFWGDALTLTEKHFNGSFGLVGVAVQGYNNMPNDIKRAFAYKLSKITGFKSGQIFQSAKGFANSTGKLASKLGPVGTALGILVIGYELKSDTWDAHTIINGTLMVGAGVAAVFAAPMALTGIAIYGVGDYFFDFSDGIDNVFGRNSGLW